jgi:hypothetical protein
VRIAGFLTAVVVFAVAQSILAPFVAKMTRRHTPAFLGGLGLASTLVALLLAALLSRGLSIRGLGA